MADIQDALDAILSGDAELTGFVGDRCYALAAPEAVTYPYIKYFNVSGFRGILLGGEFDNTERERWQFDVYADDPAIAKAIKRRLMTLLKIVQQTINIADGSEVFVQGSIPQSYANPHKDKDTFKWSCSVEALIMAEVA